MVHMLFVLYTLLFGISLLGGGDGHILFGGVTALAVMLWLLRNLDFLDQGSYFARKYARFLILLPILALYFILPYPIASAVCYAFVAGWLYGFPGLRLIVLRSVYARAIRRACRRRNYPIERAKSGFILRTPAKVYDLRLIGSLRRVGVVTLTDEAHYTIRLVPPYVGQSPTLLRDLLDTSTDERQLLRRLLVGKARTHALRWSDIASDGRTVERVMVFLPGLCEWRFAHGDRNATNGSMVNGILLYEADAFVENRLS